MENDKENPLDFYGRVSSIITWENDPENGKELQIVRLGWRPDEKRADVRIRFVCPMYRFGRIALA
jgi:hypothetical protein